METRQTLDEIYLRLDRVGALRELEPKPKGNYIELLCPSCRKRTAYIYKNGITIKCNRANECGETVSLWDYIQAKGGLSQQDTLKELARLAQYPLPELAGFDEGKYKAEKAKEDVLERALSLFKGKLFDKDGEKVLEYLKKRGYTEDEIRAIDLGFIPSQTELRKSLKAADFTDETVSSSGLLTKGFGDTHTLAIPSRDHIGRLQGFIVRSILSEAELKSRDVPKYLYNAGLKRGSQLFNIDKNLRRDTLILVEGYLDALLGTVRGLEGIVSAGGNNVTEDQIDHAIKYGASKFILALDNDRAGSEGTGRTLRLLQARGVKGYVVTLPDGHKDPEELIRAKGIDAFRERLAAAEAGIKWEVKSILSKHSIQGKQLTDRERDGVIDEALRLSETASDPIDGKYLVDTLSDALSIPVELLAPKFEDYQQKKAKEGQIRGYQDLNAQASRLLSDGNLDELDRLYRDGLKSIREKGIVRVIQPYTLPAFRADTLSKKPGLKTGYKDLDQIITIPQEAITIIAGRPSHGKTTLLLNLFLNMTETYTEKRFFFFSYEENRQKLALKCIKIMSGARDVDIEEYVKAGKDGHRAIEEAQAKYGRYADTGRLWIIYEPYFINELTDTIDFLSNRYDNIGAIFIDYIQKVKIKGTYSSRQLELQKISAEILEAANRNKLPIILGAQFNREVKEEANLSLASLREAGDIEQDANLVLGIFNKDFAEQSDTRDHKKATLTVKVLKNRDGQANKDVPLELDRPIQKIENNSQTC